jgi:hypothetical protein
MILPLTHNNGVLLCEHTEQEKPNQVAPFSKGADFPGTRPFSIVPCLPRLSSYHTYIYENNKKNDN